MKTETSYYFILFVYISLWSCQLVTSHLTHSLIILTDSYINLFKILDILLGIVHLRTQVKLSTGQTVSPSSSHDSKLLDQTLSSKLFGCICTYQFKRLPLLGSFVNGLFLMALLLSAAIEGLQTCLHVGHSEGEGPSILTRNPLIYPMVLIGFAIVGLVMQYCSLKAHELRELELNSESLVDLRREEAFKLEAKLGPLELSARNLEQTKVGESCHLKSLASDKVGQFENSANLSPDRQKRFRLFSKEANKFERRGSELPDTLEENKIQRISLRYLSNQDDDSANNLHETKSNSADIERGSTNQTIIENSQIVSKFYPKDVWFWVRYLSSPLALISCALIILFFDSSWFTEISDATLAVLVVLLLFSASYPPMKLAGKVLLQIVPAGVDWAKLEKQLKTTSVHIVDLKDLHIWSLTPRSNRVATCKVVLDGEKVSTESQIVQILDEVRFKFLEHNIRCTTIEPVFSCQKEQISLPRRDND